MKLHQTFLMYLMALNSVVNTPKTMYHKKKKVKYYSRIFWSWQRKNTKSRYYLTLPLTSSSRRKLQKKKGSNKKTQTIKQKNKNIVNKHKNFRCLFADSSHFVMWIFNSICELCIFCHSDNSYIFPQHNREVAKLKKK